MRTIFITSIAIFAAVALVVSLQTQLIDSSWFHNDQTFVWYTTGDENLDEYLYEDSIEWEVVGVLPDKNQAGVQDGWTVLIHLLDESELEMEAQFVTHHDGLAQVKHQGEWVTQQEFENELRSQLDSKLWLIQNLFQ